MFVKILNLDDVPDSVGDTFDPNGLEVPDDRINVYADFDTDRLIGTALLEKREDGVYAEFNLYFDNTSIKYPAIGGYVFARDGSKITKCRIEMVSLSDKANADSRIQPLTLTS